LPAGKHYAREVRGNSRAKPWSKGALMAGDKETEGQIFQGNGGSLFKIGWRGIFAAQDIVKGY